ncbi:MAG: pilus assembly protein TadG-related protein [Pseudomonadota bacterium]
MKKFLKNSSGNVAMTFALTATIVLTLAGGAVDYTRLNNAKNDYQVIADAAALAAAIEYKREPWGASKKVGEKFYNSQIANEASIEITSVTFELIDEAVVATVKGSSKNALLSIAGYKEFPFVVRSVVRLPDNPVEIALVLDNTSSMNQDGKLDALKSTAVDFVDTMLADHLEDKVKISIVPFAKYVNVGRSNYGAPWLDAKDKVTTIPGGCFTHRPVISQTGCSEVTSTSAGSWTGGGCTGPTYNDGVLVQAQVCTERTWNPPATTTSTQCTNINYGPEVTTCTPDTTHVVEWNGCVSSRKDPYNLNDSTFSKKVPGPLNIGCPQEIVPLTNKRNTLVATINGMQKDNFIYLQRTYVPQGIVWGMRTLSSQAPFTEALSSTDPKFDKRKQFLVVMTDGNNTTAASFDEDDTDPSTGVKNTLDHNDKLAGLHIDYTSGTETSAKANTALEEVCQNVKDEGIEVFSITFGSDVSAVTKGIMTNCASNDKNYFDAGSGADLLSAFQEISDKIITVYLAE